MRVSTIRYPYHPKNIRPAPRRGLAIAAVIKNEASYLPEWIDFHAAMGVEHFYFYDDGSDDGSADLIVDRLGARARVIPWQGQFHLTRIGLAAHRQSLAFAHAIQNFYVHRFIAFIDIDEFLIPKTEPTIADFLARQSGTINLSLPWHQFGSSGHLTRPEMGVLRAYTRRNHGIYQGATLPFKCIVDPAEITSNHIHHFTTARDGNLTQNDVGLRVPNRARKRADFYSNAHLQLNHYYTRSRDEFIAKMARGRLSKANSSRSRAQLERRFARAEAGQVFDDFAAKLAERLGL